MSEIRITKEDQGSTIDADIGDLVVIRLEENLTTGYQWEFKGGEDDLLDLVDSTYDSEPGDLVGRGGVRIFRFHPKSSGLVEIQLRLRRSWEPEDAFVDDFKVKIRIP